MPEAEASSAGDPDGALQSLRSADDNEQRIRALAQLQKALTSAQSVTIATLNDISQSLREGLHANNSHVHEATLEALSAYAKAITLNVASLDLQETDSHLYRSVGQLIPDGGLLERLGDAKEKVRTIARAALVELALVCFGRPQTNSEEAAFARLDRFIKEQGFGSKSAKCRTQIILYLSDLRNETLTLPLRGYMPFLMNALEDSDPIVRETAKEEITNIFSHPSVSNAARSDLRNQLLSRSSLRKPTVDHILSHVFAGQSQGSSQVPTLEEGDTQRQPNTTNLSSSASTPIHGAENVQPVYAASSKDVEDEFARMHSAFQSKETEHNWQSRDKHIQCIRGMLKGGVANQFTPVFVQGTKSVIEGILKSLASLRTTLAVSTCHLISELAEALRKSADPLVDPLLGGLLKLASSTKKILVQSVEQAAASLIRCCSISGKLNNALANAFVDKNVTARQLVSRLIALLFRTHRENPALETSGGIETLVAVLRKGLADPNPVIREAFRALFWDVHETLPQVADDLLGKLESNVQMQVEKARPTSDGRLDQSATHTPKPRPSLRAMIAAKKASSASLRSASELSREKPATVPATASAPNRRISSFNAQSSSKVSAANGTNGSGVPPRRASHNPVRQAQSHTSASPPASVSLSPTRATAATFSKPRTPNGPSTRAINAHMQSQSQGRTSISSSGTLVLDDPISNDLGGSTVAVEAIKEQAMQAEETAQRLLEISEDSNETLASMTSTPNRSQPWKASGLVMPAGTFADSPAVKSAPKTSIADSWWLQRAATERSASPLSLTSAEDLLYFDNLLKKFATGDISYLEVRQTSRVIVDRPVASEEKTDYASFWSDNRRADRLVTSVCEQLTNLQDNKTTDASLILIKDILTCLPITVSGHLSDIISTLLRVRGQDLQRTSAASNALMELLLQSSEPLYALSCLRISLDRAVKAEDRPDKQNDGILTLALRGLGNLFRRLPAEILEEEIPATREILRRGVNSASADTRHAAVLALVAAHGVIQDERRLIDLMGGDLSASQCVLVLLQRPLC